MWRFNSAQVHRFYFLRARRLPVDCLHCMEEKGVQFPSGPQCGILVVMKFFRICLICLIGLIGLICWTPQKAFALSGADVASSYLIDDKQAVAGDILVNDTGKLVRASVEHDLRIFGVLTETAIIVVRSSDPDYKPVVRSGTASVNAVSTNGQIKKGDYVTSSATPGKAAKATISGYVLGTALEDLSQNTGVISVSIRPEYAEISNARTLARLLNYLTGDLFRNVKDQGQLPMVLRYLIAGLVMLACITISFFTFSRSVPKAIEAIGRNPMARSTIMLSLSMSIGLVIATIALGLIASIVILKI